MANLDLVASLKEVELYLIKLGYKAETIAHFFSEMSFKEGFIQPLTATNIIHNNRKAGEAKGKTYHIAITGSSMQLFYDKDYLQNLEESTEDKTVYFKMLECNIKDLYTIVGVLLDRLLNEGTWVFRTLIAYFYIANEGISLIENCVGLGLPVPQKLQDTLIQLKEGNKKEL